MSILIAFIAGVLSFLSPCVLPMVPIYIGYLSGATVTPDGIVSVRRNAVTHAAAFVLGFTLIFITIFSALSVLMLYVSKTDLTRVAGIVLIVFGIHFIGIVRLPFLYQEARVQVGKRPLGYLTSLLTGMAFAAGWTPCVGPTLSGVLALGAQEETALQGTLLLIVYAAGLGVPFLLTALGLGSATRVFKPLGRYARVVEICSGVLLLAMGLLFVTNQFQQLNSFFTDITKGWLSWLP